MIRELGIVVIVLMMTTILVAHVFKALDKNYYYETFARYSVWLTLAMLALWILDVTLEG